MKPTAVTVTAEQWKILPLPDGSLMAVFLPGDYGVADRVAAAFSSDHGRSWTAPQTIFPLSRQTGCWAGCEGIVAHDGEVHLFLLNDCGTGTLGTPMSEGDKELRKILGLRLDIWHCRSRKQRQEWEPVRLIWQGYTGSLNSAIQMKSGRLVLPFSWLTKRSWGNRGSGLDAFNFHGSCNSMVIYSDDDGATWPEGTKDLKVWAPYIGGSYGACEPVVIELRDGRVWMLIRTQTGRLYESFSKDGGVWSEPRPTRFLSSDSPVGLVRLHDGRLVLIWNCCLRFPYANGGRHVIHAAISGDDGRSWRGFREVARDPRRHEPPPPGGDHGTAYPYPSVTQDNRVLYVTGQGKGRIQMMHLDPSWLEETQQRDDFSGGLEEWSVFGTLGVELRPHPNQTGNNALRIGKVRTGAAAAAIRNFPSGRKGTVRLRLRVETGTDRFRISLADHYSTPFDVEDEHFNLFNLSIETGGRLTSRVRLKPGHWHALELAWDCETRRCRVHLDGRAAGTLPLLHETLGACYLRLVALAEDRDRGALWVESVEVDVTQS